MSDLPPDERPLDFATRAVHAGERPGAPEPRYAPTATPIHPASSFVYDDTGDLHDVFATDRGYCYTRYANPTNTAFETAVAALEGPAGQVAGSVSFGSGMGAVQAALVAAGARAGARVVASRELYGATYHLLSRYIAEQGVEVVFGDLRDLDEADRLLAERPTACLLFETIANPLLSVFDVEALSAAARRHGAVSIVDNTFGTPYLVRPIERGADIVVHSATKYLGGHGDATGGVATARAGRDDLLSELRLALRYLGGVLGPFEAWTLLRGVKTLPLRMERQCDNAAKVAAALSEHPKVARVHYPGLRSHPGHALAAAQFGHGRFGGMVAFELAGAGADEVVAFLNRLRLCVPATTLGDVYTLLLYPAQTSHRALSPEARAAIGIGDGLVRLSVGIEAADDIIADLTQAL